MFLILSFQRSFVFAMDLKSSNKQWLPMERTPFKIELPPYTLLLAERVQETYSEVNPSLMFVILSFNRIDF